MSEHPMNLVNDAWLRPVEQLVLPALENKVRVLGFTAPHPGAGVSTLCRAAAETLARSGTKVLLIDFSMPVVAANPATGIWVPGEGGAHAQVKRDPSGFDMLTAVPNTQTRYIFNNGKRLKRTLFEDLADYGVIIADLPPLLEERAESINPLAVALACDQVMLVCANNLTTRNEAAGAAEKARQAGVKLGGLVWNALAAPTLGEAMAQSARRRLALLPAVAKWLERRFSQSPFLNT
jgi:Mrp family chromosome partitioning ATPase